MKTFYPILLLLFFSGLKGEILAQADRYFGEKTIIPEIPAKGEKIKLIIVSDATNEIDDIWAIALALFHPERFQIEMVKPHGVFGEYLADYRLKHPYYMREDKGYLIWVTLLP
ncbi:MAG: hypothetical protein WD431_05535 [Cyclobacteriaceae bacterium]